MSLSWTSWNRKLWFLPESLLWFLPLKFQVCLASKVGLTNEYIHCGHWMEVVKVQLRIRVHFSWHHDCYGRDLFAIWVLIYFQTTHLHGEKSCGSLHLAWILSLCWQPLLQRAELNVLSGESFLYMCTLCNTFNLCNLWNLYQIFLELALVKAVGVVTMATKAVDPCLQLTLFCLYNMQIIR